MATRIDAWGRGIEGTVRAYVADAAERWDHLYARGLGESLDGSARRARHYVIAGLVADLGGHAPRVLDAGCGFGTTFRLLRRLGPIYQGLDRSARAVQRCRDRFRDEPFCAFEVAAFERWTPRGTYDVVILDEAPRGREALEKAVGLLEGPRGVLIVALDGPAEALRHWAAARAALPEPLQRIVVKGDALSPRRCTVQAYTNLKEQAAPERLDPPASGVEAPTLRWRARAS
jgi:SAM-dependent methyltransferase